jgi:hypothetical protein
MRTRRLAFTCLVGLALLATGPVVHAAGSAEDEARAAFAQLVEAARQQQVDRFKALIASRDLAEMEAMERQRSGFFEMFMGFVAAGGDPGEYTAEVAADRITFVRRITDRSSGGTGTETTRVHMIREGSGWKFGKPRP